MNRISTIQCRWLLSSWLILSLTTSHGQIAMAGHQIPGPVDGPTRTVSLDKLLGELGSRYNVRFNYQANRVRQLAVKALPVQQFEGRIEQTLNALLATVGWQCKQLTPNTFVVQPQPSAPAPARPASVTVASVSTEPTTPTSSALPADRGIVGRATDEKGDPLPGVTVVVKGSQRGTVTDVKGEFRLTIPEESTTLVFSYVGYVAQEVAVGPRTSVDVVLRADEQSLDEVVVVGYGTQKKSEQTAAVSTISATDIIKAPVSDVSNSLTGRVTGVISRQGSGKPGDSGADIFIRGRASGNSAALIIVDGVERQAFGNIDANEIESISVLKDASATALFGIKGANGVIIVTTKKGKEGKVSISYSGNVGIVGYTGIPRFLDAYTSASLHNEGEDNLIKYGLLPATFRKLFSPTDLETYKNGTGDPLLYPNTNWYEALTRKSWSRTQHNLNFSGGSKLAKYFVSVGYLFEDGMFKDFSNGVGYRTTPSFNRYNFRSNLDFNLTPTTTFSLRLSGRLENKHTIKGNANTGNLVDRYNTGPESLIGRVLAIPSWGVPFYPQYTNPQTDADRLLDNTYNQIENQGVLGINTFNPYAQLKRAGYVDLDNNAIESIFLLDQRLDRLTKGLALRVTFGYDAYISGIRAQDGLFAAYDVNRQTGQLGLARNTYDDVLGGVSTARVGYIKTNLQVALNYAREFGLHTVGATVVGQRELRGADGANAPFANQGVVLRATYNYNRRYYVELNGAYNGSENYPAQERYGLFPAVSAGWTISEENFMRGLRGKGLDFLKIRGSIGLIGYGNVSSTNRFLYVDEYSNGGSTPGTGGGNSPINNRVYFGNPNGATANPVAWHSRVGNPGVTWEKSIKRNIGLESSFFNSRLTFNLDLFDERRYDILLSRTNSGAGIYGEALPQINFGENRNKGYEVELAFNNTTAGSFTYGLNAQVTHAVNEVVKADEAVNLPANLRSVGQGINQFRGYQVLGFYQNEEEIRNGPNTTALGNPVIPGDLRYADVSGPDGVPDGLIDSNDRTAIGYTDIPQFVFGLEPKLGYKGFTLTALFQGAAKVSSNIINLETGRFQYYSQMADRWTPDNPVNATWPVIKPSNVSGNPSYQFNSFLLQDASYVKLRNVEIGYQFPSVLTRKLKLQTLRVFLNGQNLYTWTKFIGLDPENQNRGAGLGGFATASAYPVTRVYNLGVNVQF